jgi:hypothetical protein
MKLNEIISKTSSENISFNFEILQPYLKSLYVFFKDYYNCEPVLMVTDVFNACSYAKIVSSNEFAESICHYLNIEIYEIENNDDHLANFETINFNSKMLKDLIN